MRMIKEYTDHVDALERIRQLENDPNQETFFKALLGGLAEYSTIQPPESRDAAMAKFDSMKSFQDAAQRLFDLKHKLGDCLKISRPLAADYKNYPDFAKIHLMLSAVFHELARHGLIFD